MAREGEKPTPEMRKNRRRKKNTAPPPPIPEAMPPQLVST
jgi:hypothetical protein